MDQSNVLVDAGLFSGYYEKVYLWKSRALPVSMST